MNFGALIDAVVRQTTILIAHLATAAGLRAPLAHLANQVFIELVRELEAQGVGRKVVADMFGIALRSYQLKVQRLRESATERNRTLWEAVLGFVQEERVVSRSRVLDRFAYDDEAQVRAVLNDLVESGLVYKTGRRNATAYRAAAAEDLGEAFQADESELAAHLLWVIIYSLGGATVEALCKEVRLEEADVRAALKVLEADGRVRCEEDRWVCEVCLLPQGTRVGWEAAVFHHFQAVVTSMCIKLREGQTRSLPSDVVGGSTWTFDIWEGHPRQEEVLGLLAELRGRVSKLREEVTLYNE